MATHIDNRLYDLRDQVQRFASEHIAGREDLHQAGTFPFDLWRKMAATGLMGIGIPASFGGREDNYLAAVVAGESLVLHGGNMGMALAWLIHVAVSRFVIGQFAADTMKEQYLPKLSQGEMTLSLAISEPGRGDHPKHLKTAAAYRDGMWILNGEKTMLTNGPMADGFVVLAVSGHDGGRKAFTAFLIPRDAPGLSVGPPIDFGFLRPTLHGGITLNDCPCSPSQIVGTIGKGYTDIGLPFRETEDMLLTGPLVGGLALALHHLVDHCRRQSCSASMSMKEELGRFVDLVQTLRIMAYETAAMRDSGKAHPEFTHLLQAFRGLAGHLLYLFSRMIGQEALQDLTDLNTLINDLTQTVRIAGNVLRIRRIRTGETLLTGKD
jgi:alkylation response protein AidB-like acyl-CoA dehydrogenase